MASFTIRSAPDLGLEGMKDTVDFLDLVKVGEGTYETRKGTRLKLIHDQRGYSLEPEGPDRTVTP
jgi:hypothetical protein